MEEDDGKINICEQTVHEFHSFNFMFQGGYKDIGVIRYLFETIVGIRDMSKVYPKPHSEMEALDELINSALAYRIFLTKNQEKYKAFSDSYIFSLTAVASIHPLCFNRRMNACECLLMRNFIG